MTGGERANARTHTRTGLYSSHTGRPHAQLVPPPPTLRTRTHRAGPSERALGDVAIIAIRYMRTYRRSTVLVLSGLLSLSLSALPTIYASVKHQPAH